MSLIVTILEGHVEVGRAVDLQAAYSDAVAGPFPPGLVSSKLLRSADDSTVWRVQTLWASRDHLEQMRSAGKPKGVQMFEAAGAIPTLTVFEVVDELTPPHGAA